MRVFLLILFSCISFALHAQLTVSEQNINASVQALAGEGVKISNVTSDCGGGSFGASPHGVFDDPFGITGLDGGLILTTGAARNVLGPNDSPSDGQDNFSQASDPHLNYLVSDQLYDMCKVEFDIEVTHTELSFNYVFGSEEYPEYVGKGYNDAFGFFVSGDFGGGVSGTKNLAVVPGSNYPVSVDNINDYFNYKYYVNNGLGATPYSNPFIQYDGYTRPLVARTNVLPCETYHVKLVIADVGDGILDSGVLIEEGSFQSNSPVKVEVAYDSERLGAAVEGCNDGYFTLVRTNEFELDQTKDYVIELNGSAKEGVDYLEVLEKTITIPAGEMSSDPIPIIAYKDSIDELLDIVRLDVQNICPNFPPLTTGEMPIKDNYEYNVPDEIICWGDGKYLNTEAVDSLDSFLWADSPNLSECLACASPFASPVVTDSFPVVITDRASGCEAFDTVTVFVHKVEAAFDFKGNDEYTVLDVDFKNKTKGATDYEWSFGDGSGSNEKNPIHFYPFVNEKDQDIREYPVTLIATHSKYGCKDTASAVVVLDETLFIPNIITPNGDFINESFTVEGISTGIWDFTVYNRYGDRVFFSSGYLNDWRGLESIAGFEDKSKELSDGTYFYLLENPKKDRQFKGWIEVVR